jgi:hypothetical protein
VTRAVRGRKVEDEREGQVRVRLMCFVKASQGEMKVLRRVRVVRRGKMRAERRTRERFRSAGCVERDVVKGIIVMEVVT